MLSYKGCVCLFMTGFYLRTRAQHMYTTDGSSTPYCRLVFYLEKSCKISGGSSHSTKFLLFINVFTVIYYFLRVNHQPNGEQMTLGCLKMALCGAHLLLIRTSMVLTMTVRRRKMKRRPIRKAA